jgi:formate/nitrite transporter FocA (FNT family)
VEGFGFSTGFFFVVLSEAVLFTEANVAMPATLFRGVSPTGRVLRFWGLAFVGNLIGAIITGGVIQYAQVYSAEFDALLAEIVAFKMSYRDIGGVEGWFKLILSGMLANWLVGMAAFSATREEPSLASTSLFCSLSPYSSRLGSSIRPRTWASFHCRSQAVRVRAGRRHSCGI